MKLLKVPDATHEQLARLAALYEVPMSRIAELLIAASEEAWRQRMTADEWARFLAEDVSRAESRRIRQREDDGAKPTAIAGRDRLTATARSVGATGRAGGVT